MFCAKCGVSLQEGSQFCDRCGAPTTARSIRHPHNDEVRWMRKSGPPLETRRGLDFGWRAGLLWGGGGVELRY